MGPNATNVITIDAPPDVVWGLVGDITRHGEWSPKPFTADLVSGEPNTVGARYRSVGWVPPNDGHHGNDVVITEVVPGSRFVLEGSDANGTFTNAYDVKAVEGGTEVTWHIQFPEMKGLNAVMVPLLFPLVAKPDFRKRMALLKAKAEGAD